MNKLEQLKQFTTVVADTGDIQSIQQYQPQDATTNPSLLLKAAQMPEYQHLIDEALAWAKQQSNDKQQQVQLAIEKLMINFGKEILQIIPGRVSTEVDAHLSFDTEQTIKAAERIIELYEQQGVSKDRVLIKVASTWEGIQAAKQLQRAGIQCNLTLLFSLAQAAACFDAGVTLISPFVGRIYDWYKQKNKTEYVGAEDPGVQSVTTIYQYAKQHGYDTVVMGASFRNTGQIEALAGCDYLTISPGLMGELQQSTGQLSCQLNVDNLGESQQKLNNAENVFRWHLNQDAMATEKLADGIRIFAQDMNKLKSILQQRIA